MYRLAAWAVSHRVLRVYEPAHVWPPSILHKQTILTCIANSGNQLHINRHRSNAFGNDSILCVLCVCPCYDILTTMLIYIVLKNLYIERCVCMQAFINKYVNMLLFSDPYGLKSVLYDGQTDM